MRVFSAAVVTLLLWSSLAIAQQQCPPTTSTTTTNVAATTGTTGTTPAMGVQPSAQNFPTVQPVCATARVDRDTSCLLQELAAVRSELRALRGQLVASALQLQGQQLVSRLNQLTLDEMMLRNNLAANPNYPNAQQQAQMLQTQANTLAFDIQAFNNQMAMVPMDMRPYVAPQLSAFDQSYWTPAMNRFAMYRTQFPTVVATYQTASTANPWLQGWLAGYQTALNTIGTSQQIATANVWWTNTQVLGTTEMYPNANMHMGMTAGTGTMGTTGTTGTGTTQY
ncbi:MAG: hypothetical protein ACYC7E_03590 [Armatimonadota bacterium]